MSWRAKTRPRIEPESLNGTNDIEIHVFANEARRQALLVAKFDNLGKGASGAAVQNLMLMLGRSKRGGRATFVGDGIHHGPEVAFLAGMRLPRC